MLLPRWSVKRELGAVVLLACLSSSHGCFQITEVLPDGPMCYQLGEDVNGPSLFNEQGCPDGTEIATIYPSEISGDTLIMDADAFDSGPLELGVYYWLLVDVLDNNLGVQCGKIFGMETSWYFSTYSCHDSIKHWHKPICQQPDAHNNGESDNDNDVSVCVDCYSFQDPSWVLPQSEAESACNDLELQLATLTAEEADAIADSPNTPTGWFWLASPDAESDSCQLVNFNSDGAAAFHDVSCSLPAGNYAALCFDAACCSLMPAPEPTPTPASPSGDGDSDSESDGGAACLDESGVSMCHALAYCETGACECMPGTRDVSDGAGTACADTGYAVRFVLDTRITAANVHVNVEVEHRRASVPSGITTDDVIGNNLFCLSDAQGWYMQNVDLDIENAGAVAHFTEVYCLYPDQATANGAVGPYATHNFPQGAIVAGPGMYRWVLPTTSNPIQVPPSGLQIDSVSFDPSGCAQTGCWVVTGTLTTGESLWENNVFNTFFLPAADIDAAGYGDGAISFDFDYSSGGTSGSSDVPVEWTFQPAKHPCTSDSFDASGGNTQEVTTCCITNPGYGETGGADSSKGGFLTNYRVTQAFASWTADLSSCAGTANAQVIQRPGYTVDGSVATYEVPFPANAIEFLSPTTPKHAGAGKFWGMPNSPGVTELELTDPFFGQYKFEIHLDEVELRSKAGKLTGTVGVEHAVDTFLGLSNFRTTGSVAIDTFSTQVAIHLEKTSFFTVSTHGTNDYTFLEYVNLRLVAVYEEDADFSGEGESAQETVRTSSEHAALYVQVTFTLGSQYAVNANSGLIPSSSVRAGTGAFFDTATLTHKCDEWAGVGGRTFAAKSTFEARLDQTSCAPGADMCTSPLSIPDSFVSFNIPIGVGEDGFGAASSTLSNNVFVDMVISAVDTDAAASPAPNSGGDPQQMKTTLTASIPVVEGGINIFCDGYTAKTDLKDVANADILVGSASSTEELTRLRIKKDIASTQLSTSSITQIDSDSIEAGLMTLVLKGSDSYFDSNTGRKGVTLELEDVITIHIMESDGDGSNTGVAASVLSLVAAAPDDNSDIGGLDTDGYKLNDAFHFTIDRSSQRAHLEPSTRLLEICAFNPPRPVNSVSLETCVVRRDVRYRGFPARAGAKSTAMEICAAVNPATATGSVCPSTTTDEESAFFTTIFGDSANARQLAKDYADVINAMYTLNGRYRRAFWINPGYEWTPTQTGGTPLFSVSQKLFLFALITLDEGIASGNGAAGAPLDLPSLSRRRMLLQSAPEEALQDGQASINAEAFEFKTTPASMMAKAFAVPEDRVATFKVTLQLTSAEACMSPTELQASVRATLHDYLSSAASAFHTVQVMSVAVDKARVTCRRRSVRSLLSSFSEASAEVTMLVVFEAGTKATLSVAKLQTMAGIAAVEPLRVSPKVDTSAVASNVPLSSPAEDTSSSSIGLIAGGAAGGAVALIALGVGVLVMIRKRNTEREVASVVQTINVDDLKHALAEDV